MRGSEGAAAEREEILAGAGHVRADRRGPHLRNPALRALEFRLGRRGRLQRPRQRGPVDLAGGAGREFVDERETGDDAGRQRFAQQARGVRKVERVGVDGDEVGDEDARARVGLLHRRRARVHTRQRRHGGVDLAELDAAATDLHLVVDAPAEVEAVGLEADEVAGSVGPFPAEARHRRVFFRVLLRIEIAGEPDAADDELAGPADRDRLAGAIDDREVPAVQRQTDGDLAAAGELRGAGDDRRLGGPVGVPHLATAAGDEAGGELRRAGLSAEDDHAHPGEHRIRPHRCERRHRGDDRDVALEEPRSEVEAALDDRPRSGDEARAVRPREPHLLAGGVERDGQPGEHTVARAQRLLLQEQASLGVHERGS